VSHSELDLMPSSGLTQATAQRTKMLSRSLIAFERVDHPRQLRTACRKTGLYPVSYDNFLLHAEGVKDIPPDVLERLEQHAKA
jgi:hypothetical protein